MRVCKVRELDIFYREVRDSASRNIDAVVQRAIACCVCHRNLSSDQSPITRVYFGCTNEPGLQQLLLAEMHRLGAQHFALYFDQNQAVL
jgi:hypothetical protein